MVVSRRPLPSRAEPARLSRGPCRARLHYVIGPQHPHQRVPAQTATETHLAVGQAAAIARLDPTADVLMQFAVGLSLDDDRAGLLHRHTSQGRHPPRQMLQFLGVRS